MARAKHEEPAVEAAPADAPAVPATVRARVLMYCDLGKPNDVIEIDAELATTRADVVDTDPAAVAYALTQVG